MQSLHGRLSLPKGRFLPAMKTKNDFWIDRESHGFLANRLLPAVLSYHLE